MAQRYFGEISAYPVGSTFNTRKELHDAGVHRPLQAGISGSGQEGADSIVVSGGYEDDQDEWEYLVYTGHGGNEPNSGRQIADQHLERGNLALAKNCQHGLPVRVIRGAGGDPRFAPAFGYRYDGLYSVDSFWHERGRSGFVIWRFRLIRLPDQTTPS